MSIRPPKTRVLVVDDHPVVRAGLCDLIRLEPDAEVAGEAASGRECLEKVQDLKPDVVLLDVSMPGMPGLEVLKHLTKHCPTVCVVIVSAHTEQEYVWASLRAGARGYMSKGMDMDELGEAIRSAMRGDVFLSKELGRKFKFTLGQIAESKSPVDSLTPRDREVLTMIAEGKTTKEAALILNLSPKTIEYFRAQLYRKLGMRNVQELALFAKRNGLVS